LRLRRAHALSLAYKNVHAIALIFTVALRYFGRGVFRNHRFSDSRVFFGGIPWPENLI